MRVGYWGAESSQPQGMRERLDSWAEQAGWSGYLLRATVSCYSGFRRTLDEASPSADAMLSEYYQLDLEARDPVRRAFVRKGGPVAWEFSDLFDGDDSALGTLNQSHGFGSGIELPLLGPPGVGGWLIVLSEKQSWSQRALDAAMKDAFFTAAGVAAELHALTVAARVPRLTARERECLRLTAAGKTSIEIGMILNITPRTVDFHIGNCVTKLGCSSRRHAVSSAIGLGIIGRGGA